MKKLFTLSFIAALTFSVSAQAPQKMSYQAVIRNPSGDLVTYHDVGMKISILQGSAFGTVVYAETYNPVPQTNGNGLVTIEIGGGTPSAGTFSSINWAAGPYYLKTETDPAGGTNYTITGTSQLLSVPYALYSGATGNINETDPTWHGTSDEVSDVGRAGKVGIGTISPVALLHTYGTGTGEGNVAFVGSFKSSNPGDPPVSGAGTRMMWYPDKAAFRAGYVNGNYWDKENIGSHSVGLGFSTTASGAFSFATGSGSKATGEGSSALGSSSTASGSYSFTAGLSNTVSGSFSVAFGNENSVSGGVSVAMGSNSVASGSTSVAIGNHVTASSVNSFSIGSYNIGGGNASVWTVTDPLFEIGNGTSLAVKKNAMTVLKNGYVGIGIHNPLSGLHLKGNGWPDAFMIFQSESGQDAGIRLMEGTTPKWSIFCDGGTDGLQIYNNGGVTAIFCKQVSPCYVGIGTSNPTCQLQVGTIGDGSQARANAWNLLSDMRLKKDIADFSDPLEMLAKLNGFYFYWKTGSDRSRQTGLSAQEVKEVLPEVVSSGDDGYLAIDYGKITPLLVEAIKAQQNEISTLKDQYNELKAQFEKLKSKLAEKN